MPLQSRYLLEDKIRELPRRPIQDSAASLDSKAFRQNMA
jgi:hypothetical protein